MTDECPTHGTDCPGHLHVEVAGGKAYVSRPGSPPPYPIDLEKVRWTAHPSMKPLQQFGSFLLSETEIAWMKQQGMKPPW